MRSYQDREFLEYKNQIKDIEDMDAVYERLESIYDKLGDKEKSKESDCNFAYIISFL